MRVLLVEIYGRGGLTHYTYNLARELARRQVEVTLLTGCEYELATRVSPGGNGFRVEACFYRRSERWTGRRAPARPSRLRRWLKAAEYVLDTPRVVRAYRRERADLAHLQGSNPILVVTLAALKLAGARAVYTAHDVSPLSHRALARLLDQLIYRLADCVVVHSDADREALLGRFHLAPSKVVVIRHGNYLFFRPDGEGDRAEARRGLGLGETDRVLLFFGFLSWYKGLDVLLRAFRAVRDALPQARLVVVGDPLKLGRGGLAACRRLARDLGVEKSLVLRAEYLPMHEVPPYFVAADCVVLPYREVSQSGVLHLAYAFGRPVVATRVGGFPEAVREEETGLLVPPEDPAALAAALIRLLADDEARCRMGAAARRAAEEQSCSWAEVAERTRELYGAVAAR